MAKTDLQTLVEGLEADLDITPDESLNPEGRLTVCEREACHREYEAATESAEDGVDQSESEAGGAAAAAGDAPAEDGEQAGAGDGAED